MKNQSILLIIITGVALVVGLILGYFLFGKKGEPVHQHKATQSVEASTTYTCSMHPQIRQNEPGICPICEMELIPAESGSSENPLVLEMTERSVQLSNIQTTTVGQTGQASKELRLSGKIKVDERTATTQVAHISGRIERLFVTFTGEKIKKGQALATVYSPDLINAQQELVEALKLGNTPLLEAARKKLSYWKISKETIKKVEESGDIQEIFTVFADADGVVTNRKVAVGDYVRQGQPLFDLVQLNKLWVLFDAYEEDLGEVSIGNRVDFTTPAVPNRTFSTQITFIDPVINPMTRVASIRGEVSNFNGSLKPEMFVTGVLMGKVHSGTGLTVPKSAVLWTGTRSVVYVKIPNTTVPSFEFREVELGEGLGQSYLVKKGLTNGEEVVTNGAFVIDAAAQLNNQASMMNRGVKVKGKVANQESPDYQLVTPEGFKKYLGELTRAYLSIKNAMVMTNATEGQKAATNFIKTLESNSSPLVDKAANDFYKAQLLSLKHHGGKIESLNNIEDQRKEFQFLSNAMITTIQAFGTQGIPLYIQHCPMAFNDLGGDWISSEEQIRNPYFGEKMMKCGTVKGAL